MTDLGKVDRTFFDQYVFSNLGAGRDDVALGPTHGVDFGLLDLDGTAVAIATDPVSVLPDLGLARAGRFTLDFVLADVAVSGLPPSHLAISFTLPPDFEDESFATLWTAMHEEAEDLGVSIVTGHTARYSGCSFPWVGGATALAVGDHEDVIRPDGARVGDDVLVTKGPAVEATGLLTTLFPDQFDLPEATLRAAQSRLDEAECVRDAMTASAVGGVHAMHDATECGLFGALNEVADGAGVQLDISTDEIPIRPGVEETCEFLGMDPWTATTGGTLVLAVDPDSTAAVISALESEGTPVGVAGTVREGSGVTVDGEEVPHPDVDPSWAAYEELMRQSGVQ
ncbi:hydrogenase expression protein [Halogeometricum borinquense]|uniref:Hydrogenase expression protein n=1 Tax=Halogeometricum borinquense TaxID=60847 RepID=A0A6C0UHX2_9EURY|nr:AIR synthase family protein [Halogeometricum borinquense]QIB75164.1 hydrogenase expression protein [Halogeometricum borinquense]QIQ75855.1 hydrogenase expression protein [Halogeometricum borinquense]